MPESTTAIVGAFAPVGGAFAPFQSDATPAAYGQRRYKSGNEATASLAPERVGASLAAAVTTGTPQRARPLFVSLAAVHPHLQFSFPRLRAGRNDLSFAAPECFADAAKPGGRYEGTGYAYIPLLGETD